MRHEKRCLSGRCRTTASDARYHLHPSRDPSRRRRLLLPPHRALEHVQRPPRPPRRNRCRSNLHPHPPQEVAACGRALLALQLLSRARGAVFVGRSRARRLPVGPLSLAVQKMHQVIHEGALTDTKHAPVTRASRRASSFFPACPYPTCPQPAESCSNVQIISVQAFLPRPDQ